jgi:hypothetical protein
MRTTIDYKRWRVWSVYGGSLGATQALGTPRLANYTEMSDEREDVRERLRARLHILEGLSDALGRMDQINGVLRNSSDRPAARSALMADPFNYSEVVATHVLDMTVSRQTNQGVEELRQEILKARAFLGDSDWPPT